MAKSAGTVSEEVRLVDPGSLCLHAKAEAMPELPARGFTAFSGDIERRGIVVPLDVTPAGVVLDGRQRLRAATELQLVQVPVRIVSPADEFEYMLRAALLRRDLTPSQRAALAIELEEHEQRRSVGKARRLANLRQNVSEVAALPPRGRSREQAAAFAGVSPRTVQDAITVRANDPQLFEQLKAGSKTASYAARQVRRQLRDAQLADPGPLPTGALRPRLRGSAVAIRQPRRGELP